MKRLHLDSHFAIFILFFGIALIEAFKKHNWIEAILFTLVGLMFIRFEDNKIKTLST